MQKTDNKRHLERFSQLLAKVESVMGAIEISVVIVYYTSCTSEKICTESPINIMTNGKNS